MKTLRLLPTALFAVGLCAAGVPWAAAQNGDATTIKFSDPSKPGTLKLNLNSGDLRIQGSDTDEISVATEIQPSSSEQRKDGLRVLTSSAAYSLHEKDNVVTLSYGGSGWGPGPGGDFEITVPRNTNIIVSSSFGGDTVIGGIAGDIELKSLNGEVLLEDVSGGVLVETMNGEIKAVVRELRADKPLSFTSMNGEVDLHLPGEAKANIRLRTHNGSILTDFDEKSLVTKTESVRNQGPNFTGGAQVAAEVRTAVREAVRVGMEAARAARDAAMEAARNTNNEDVLVEHDGDMPVPPTPPLPPMTGGKIVSGTLNGGGTEIRITTMNGDITLRKAQ
ncbi:MAG: DUF4097 domain-containing protein [Opitutus sp.]|nr:DUF4097 domain-containing protein [Opitutus sp.]